MVERSKNPSTIHRFPYGGRNYAIDSRTCFCFECDAVSWDVLKYYPATSTNRILHLLGEKHNQKEIEEVISELEWLRRSNSILKDSPKPDEFVKSLGVDTSLKQVSVILNPSESTSKQGTGRRFLRKSVSIEAELSAHINAAFEMLLARSQSATQLTLTIVSPGPLTDPNALSEFADAAFRRAAVGGKTLRLALAVTDLSVVRTTKTLNGHTLDVLCSYTAPQERYSFFEAARKAFPESLQKLHKQLTAAAEGGALRVTLRPGHESYAAAIEELDKAGFPHIEIDLAGAYAQNRGLDPAKTQATLEHVAHYYAERLRKHHYFRLDPFADLFRRIYDGQPIRSANTAGTGELAVDAAGDIYPSPPFLGNEGFRIGSLSDCAFDEDVRAQFDDLTVNALAPCTACWANSLCGAGDAAVHHALNGDIIQPHPTWCDGQRQVMAASIAAFNTLASEGINFTRVYENLTPREKPSLFTMAKAAFRMQIGMRNIEESDAELLTKWENWNDAAYFLFNETGMFLATRYDREMDSLYPKGFEIEMMLLRKNGDPFGLFKIRPEYLAGGAGAWIFFRDVADYGSEAIRKSFRFMLGEAGKSHGLRVLTAPAGKGEAELAAFLTAVGFRHVGTQRQALYLHRNYTDVDLFSITLD